MGIKSQEFIAKNQKKVVFEFDKEAFEAAIMKVFHKSSSKISVPGFRKGKAPRSIIERMYGKGVFYEDAIDDLIPDAWAKIFDETEETIVSRPNVDIESVDENGLVLNFTFFTKPDIEIKNYTGLEAERPIMEVTDEDIADELKRVQQRNARKIEVNDRPVQEGDTVKFDFEGFTDGVPFEGGKSENYSLKIGSKQFIPGFEDQIIGHSIDEPFDVNVSFPEDYHSEDLKGKDATFKCLIHGIEYDELPELDDEFAKDVSEFDTLDEYKASIKEKFEKENDDHAESHVTEALNNKLIDLVEGDIPECMFENETEQSIKDFENRLKMNGMDLDLYLKYTGLDMNSLRKEMRPQAEQRVKLRLALEKIAKLEKIEATEDEIADEYKKLSEQYGLTVEQIKEMVKDEDLAEDIKVKKAADFVREKAVVKDVEHVHHDHDHKHDDGHDHDEE